jgi:hypothetical protein
LRPKASAFLLAGILLCVVIVAGSAYGADSKPLAASEIRRIDVGTVDFICGIHAAPDGDLVVLTDHAKALSIIVVSPDGQRKSSLDVPAEAVPVGIDPSRFVAAGDDEGNFYVSHSGEQKLWMISHDGSAKPLDLGMPANAFAVTKASDGESIVVLGTGADGVRIHLPDLARQPLKLSDMPTGGGLTDLRVGADGDLYGYSLEHVIWHYASDGKLLGKIGGGGAAPPHQGMPGEFTSSLFDVAANGDVVWTSGDYGQLNSINAAGTQAIRFGGNDEKGRPWTPPFYQMAGLAISGDKAYAVGGTMMTEFPLSVLTAGAPGTATGDPRLYGLTYLVTSPQPYKLFGTPDVSLGILFPKGNRTIHQVNLNYTVFDLWQHPVAQGSADIDVPGNGEVAHALPAITLSNLGWYRLDTSISTSDGNVLADRTNLIGRTFDDPALPIPAKEVSGWNDLETHKMVGMGLHRFAANQLHDLTTNGPEVAEAKKLNVPFFFKLTNRPDVTPANVRMILANQPDLQRLEIMNEPDQQGVSPEVYVQKYLKPCYEEAHRIKPDIQIMGPTKCGIELQWMDRFFKAGGGKYVDIVSVHTYERNNSMDAYHWNWKLAKLKEMMAAYGCGNKPLYQTEHGYSGDFHGFILRPQWQAWSMFDEYLAFDRVGTSPDHFYYYYVNEGGYADCSTQLVDGNRELYPAALLMRTRAHLLKGEHFESALDLGPVGNWLVLGNRYTGPDNDVVILTNTGAFKDVDLAVTMPAAAKVYDCWGNPAAPATVPGHLAIGMYPTYVVVPHGATVEVKLPWSGKDIAPTAKFTIDDPQAQANTGRLTNGELEFDFHDEPDRQGMYGGYGHLPLDLTATWPTPKTIDHIVLYGNLSDNQYCTPLDYDLEARVNGKWQAIEEVRVPAEGRIQNVGLIARITSYPDPWIFVHQFAPLKADAIRFHFTKTTFGQYPTAALTADLIKSYHWGPILPAVQLRELQIFSPATE